MSPMSGRICIEFRRVMHAEAWSEEHLLTQAPCLRTVSWRISLALTIVAAPAQTQQALAGTPGAEVEACARLSSALLALGHQV